MFKRYFAWLQKKAPVGEVEKYPELDRNNETSVKGVYIVGDLTGVPLLKTATESGAKLVQDFKKMGFETQTEAQNTEGVLDILIVGAGPSGIGAALECERLGYQYELLEVSQAFNTIENFPKGKLILAKPDNMLQKSQLKIVDGHKESLLEDLHRQIKDKGLKLSLGVMVQKISKKSGIMIVETNGEKRKARRVILGIGKSGNGRQLKVPGENLSKVLNKLYDPQAFKGKEVLVVGGGDSALEASIALAQAGNQVTHSYRKGSFSRPKEENAEAFQKEIEAGRIRPLFTSQVKEIKENEVTLKTKEGEESIKNDAVFTLIGRELPLAFFKRSKIKMEGEKDLSWKVYLTAMLSFFVMLYFGKSGFGVDLFLGKEDWLSKFSAYFTSPWSVSSSWSLEKYHWYASLNFYLGWAGSLVWIVSGTWAFGLMLKQREKYFGNTWNVIKYSYLIFVSVFFTWVYFKNMLHVNVGWAYEPTYYYSLLYCTTMALFGFRRAYIKRTGYIKRQMITLVSIQVFFLFLLPYYLYDPWIAGVFSPDSYVIREMFPQGKWSAFGFILLWPLNMNNFGTSTFWTWYPFVQTFGILFYLVYKYGKGAYCGWICSCGGMAETLGDEYRQKSPHGPTAKKMENIGQGILVYAVVVTVISYFVKQGMLSDWKLVSDILVGTYKFSIDVIFAGVLGLGVYFFMGGRIWCRYGCPLAALMHIYTRFSKYRILSEKKKCISCNICTKVCHMGIDVMNYANKGIPMNDVECVRCSTCVHSCPTEVLSFEELIKGDVENLVRQDIAKYGKVDWRAGVN